VSVLESKCCEKKGGNKYHGNLHVSPLPVYSQDSSTFRKPLGLHKSRGERKLATTTLRKIAKKKLNEKR
jgi:hypothetical protein